MRGRIEGCWKRLSLAQQFIVAILVILASGMIGIGWWVGQEIKGGVIHQTGATTALYVDSVVAPLVQELGQGDGLTSAHVASLKRLLHDTPLGQQIVAFKIWDAEGRIVYSTNPAIIGRIFPLTGGLVRAWHGKVASSISELHDEEHAPERERWAQLLETYTPVRLKGGNRIIAVAEFYQTVDNLEKEVLAAQMSSWLVVGAATVAMFLLLAGIVRRGSDTIARQQRELSDRVTQLTGLLAQNEELHERVRRAATRTAALNERFLRRVSAELHDGPAQVLGLVLLRLDSVIAHCAAWSLGRPEVPQVNKDLDMIQRSMRHALHEIRVLSTGLVLPELDNLTVPETLARVVRVHERRTETQVMLRLNGLPAQAPLPVKITLYRLIQEALNNAYRHGGGVGQEVRVQYDTGYLRVEVSDHGPGFDWAQGAVRDEQLGLVGMRERVESLGGIFHVESGSGRGTKVIAHLALHPVEGHHER
ncbi:MAG: sensor histidine kinase [Candidatus Methylomirabilales bacterium]